MSSDASIQSGNESRAIAAKALQARDRFFALASHELKTPISVLKMQIQLRQKNINNGDLKDFAPENLAKLCEEDGRQVNRLGRLVDNILDASKISVGAIELLKTQTDISNLLKAVVAEIEPTLRESGNLLRLEIEEGVSVRCDSRRLAQAVANLLTNCARHAPGCAVTLGLKNLKKNVIIAVQDQGPGISKELLEMVLDPFERMNRKVASGLGLGLYIVKEITGVHGGTFRLNSEPGHGTLIEIHLPVEVE